MHKARRLRLKLEWLRHPDPPRFHQRGEGSPILIAACLGRSFAPPRFARPRLEAGGLLENGFAQDDAVEKIQIEPLPAPANV
jgi:hypothetical protein